MESADKHVSSAEPIRGADLGRKHLELVAPRAGGLLVKGQFENNLRHVKEIDSKKRRIVICADGTWNAPVRAKRREPAPTNVWLLYQLVRPNSTDALGTPQLAYYHAGVGSHGEISDRVLGGMSGWGLKANILACYRFLVEQYRDGDEVYLFGFSRGAYTARSLAGLIRNCGVVRRGNLSGSVLDQTINDAWTLYRDRDAESAPAAKRAVDFRCIHSFETFPVTCIGVWDTVGALGIPIGGPLGWLSKNLFGFHDVTLSSQVRYGFHALAIDERRGPFTPTLWVQESGAKADGQVMEQVWFRGVHSDVGGGERWPERGLADITLQWMLNRIAAHCALELEPYEPQAVPPHAMKPHNSMSWGYSLMNRLRITTPFVRTIDGGLGEHGTRDASWVTTEAIDPSVRLFMRDAAYDPSNVKDYDDRAARERTHTRCL